MNVPSIPMHYLASFRICVDGGTNQLYELSLNNLASGLSPPHLITGDFDSIQEPVKEYYVKKGSKVIQTLDQNYTDFTKALMEFKQGNESGEYPKASCFSTILNG